MSRAPAFAVASLIAALAGGAAHAAPSVPSVAAPACAPTSVFSTALTHLDGFRVFTGPDGDSVVVPYRLDARQVPLLKTGKLLGLIQLPGAAKRGDQIVVAPPEVDLPLHKAPYREMFIMLSGSASLITAKFKGELTPGSVVLFEDTDARIGHGGHTGPCGYVSVSIAP